MGRKTRLLTNEVAALAEEGILRLGKNGAAAIKLRVILAAHRHGITKVCEIFDVSKVSVIAWVKSLSKEGIESLSVKPGRGRKGVLGPEQNQLIQKWLQEDPQQTIDQVKLRLLKETGIDLARSSVHRAIKSLPFSYVTPRPRHYKKPSEDDQIAKKKSGEADM